jgi:phage FluMu gp28-like protein
MASKKKIYVPGSELWPYQRNWADDESRWKFGLMSRQVGKDFSSGFEGIRDILNAEKKGQKRDWLIAAPSERQSLESLAKWKDWTLSFKMSVADYKEERQSTGESLLKSATITFPGGSRVIAVPGRPDTVRGFSANVLLTEFAYFEQPGETWRAILPSITNPMRGGEKKVRLITTPNGIGNKAHDLWVKNFRNKDSISNLEAGISNSSPFPPERQSAALRSYEGGAPAWSCHFVDIRTAVLDGLPVQIEQLKAALDDPEGWAQEFECQFLDVQSVLLPYELITSCESLEATAAVAPEFWQTVPPFPIIMGIDFGRRHDLTVAWSLAQLGDVRQTVEVLEMERTPTPEQVERLRPRLRQARRVCLDYTGPGIGLGDYLAGEFGEWNPARHKFGKIELCNFTNTLKLEIFSKLRMAFEKRALRVPVSRLIREDLHSVNRVSSPTGQISYRAPHSADGHADRCTALALALRASADGGATRISSASVKMRPGIGDMGVGKFRAKDWPM